MTSNRGFLSADEGAVAPLWAALLPANEESPKGAYIWYDKTVVDWVNGQWTPSIFIALKMIRFRLMLANANIWPMA